MKYDVIIVGAGQAGLSTAISLRQRKFSGSILLIGDENELPYQRPPLSKSFIVQEIKDERLFIKSKSYFKKNKVDFLNNSTVKNINRQEKYVEIDYEGRYYYGKLAICTGSVLNKINLSCNSKNIHYLRTIKDSREIKSSLNKTNKIVILGAGYIGLEIASSAIKKGLDVTIIELENRVMIRSISSQTSNFLIKKHIEAGVKFLFNTAVEDIEDSENTKKIICNNGKIIHSDVVIIGVGIKPNIKLAVNSGLACEDGILVDEFSQTSDGNIYASGDCANHPNKISKRRLRLESVQNAVEQSQITAASINGERTPYNKVPWFWSEQYNLKLQMAGILHSDYRIILKGEPLKEKFAVCYIANNKLKAIEAINDNKSFSIGKKLIKSQKKIPENLIINETVSIKDWLKESDDKSPSTAP